MEQSPMIYVAFDGKNDYPTFEKLATFKQKNQSSYSFLHAYEWATTYDKMQEDKAKALIHAQMDKAEIVILILGKTTKTMRKFIRWQVDYAVAKQMPLIVVNPSGIRSVDFERIPSILKKKAVSVHIAMEPEILETAVLTWKEKHNQLVENEKTGTYRYQNSAYEDYIEEDE